MSNSPVNPDAGKRGQDLMKVFDAAFRRLQQGGEHCNPARMPIFPRRQTQDGGDDLDHERALTDAARALAGLWKVSSVLIR